MSAEENEDQETMVEDVEEQDNNDVDSVENEQDENSNAEDSGEENTTESDDENSTDDNEMTSNESNDADSDLPEFEPSFSNDILNDYIRTALAPIDGDNPCGESEDAASSVISQIETNGDGIHESLRLAFGEAVREDNLSSFDMASVGREADALVDQIIDCLGEKCKSLILASYLPHLMLIGYGTEGFDAGLTIVRELTIRFPNRIFPQDKERLGSFLRRGVYVGNDDKVTDNYKLFLYLAVTESENLPYALLRNAVLKGSGGGIEGRYAADASRSSVDFYVQLIDRGLDSIVENARQANQALGEYLGDPTFEIVSFTFIESLERMASILRNLATDNCADYPPVEEEETESEGAGPAAVAAPQAPMTGEIVDRDQAIKMLGKIADFFYKTERHSPISYRIRDTIKWCKMDFPELLQLLLDGDESSISEMQKRVGFDDLDSDGGGYSSDDDDD
jgi:type VI secretion system protein ImpA